MRRNAAPRASGRPGILLSLVLALLAWLPPSGAALAGDAALIDFLGYSKDRDHFAFEEYGIQDGSGLAYSSIYIVELSTDRWVKGTPYRVQAPESDPDKPLTTVRGEARLRAQADLDALEISEPARILALIGDGAVDADAHLLRFADPVCCGAGAISDDIQTLRLETFESDTAFDCMGLVGQKGLGYALTLSAGGAERELHRDKGRLPLSRGCPMDYRLYAVVDAFDTGGRHVAIVSTHPFGFEGPDRRFLAVPLGD